MPFFGLLHIPSSSLYKIEPQRTQVSTLKEMKREFSLCFKQYLAKPYKNDDIEKQTVSKLRELLNNNLKVSYSQDQFDYLHTDENSSSHWVFPLIQFIKERPIIRGLSEAEKLDDFKCESSWTNLIYSEFCVVVLDD